MKTEKQPEIQLESVEGVLSWITASHGFNGSAIYRGQTSDAWPLLPSLFRQRGLAQRFEGPSPVGRDQHSEGFRYLEKHVLDLFKSRAYPFLDGTPQSNFDWMVLAQHHGCPTHLLDWTGNPLVALFFATEVDDQKEKDAVIWSDHDFLWFPHDLPDDRLTDLDRTIVYFPKHISPRIPAQAAVFTVHPLVDDKPIPMEQEIKLERRRSSFFRADTSCGSLTKAIIPAKSKEDIQRQLERLNIHRASMFPGLDGISDNIAIA